MLIDFEKAFDSLEWPFILIHVFLALDHHLSIGKLLQHRKLCGQATSSSLKEELGKVVPFPHICLFLLRRSWPRPSVTIRGKSIRGFSLGNDEVKISQYADDTILILDG